MNDPTADWAGFSDRHGPWLRRYAAAGPIHALPEPAIERLARAPRSKIPPLLDPQAEHAERDLLALCRRHRAVGLDDGRPITYPYLDITPPWPDLDEALMDLAGWTTAIRKQVLGPLPRLDAAHARVKGVAGWLVVDPAFRGETAALAARRADLPADERPDFPLRRAARLATGPIGARAASGPTATFARDFAAFCDRWELIGLATWDLPEPAGPLLPDLAPDHDQVTAGRGLRIALPIHYPVGSSRVDLQACKLEYSIVSPK